MYRTYKKEKVNVLHSALYFQGEVYEHRVADVLYRAYGIRSKLICKWDTRLENYVVMQNQLHCITKKDKWIQLRKHLWHRHHEVKVWQKDKSTSKSYRWSSYQMRSRSHIETILYVQAKDSTTYYYMRKTFYSWNKIITL